MPRQASAKTSAPSTLERRQKNMSGPFSTLNAEDEPQISICGLTISHLTIRIDFCTVPE